MALPFSLLWAYPGKDTLRARRQDTTRIVAILAISIFLMVAGLIIYRSNFEALSQRYEVPIRLQNLLAGLPTAWYHILGYLFSPAKGVFWYSPILILAVGAPFILPASRWRESWLPLAMTVTFAAAYAAIRGELWHGGVGWGGRYLVPITPFLLLGSLPMLDSLLRDTRKLTRIGLGLLIGVSLGI